MGQKEWLFQNWIGKTVQKILCDYDLIKVEGLIKSRHIFPVKREIEKNMESIRFDMN